DVPLKGLLPLVEAMAKVRTSVPAELVVVGSVRPEGPVAAAIDRYGLRDSVHFTGRLSEDDLIHELRRAEIAVVPSLFEGFSLPLVEAMACATPVIATTAGALPEVAGPDGEAALLVPPGDAGALAVAIERLLGDPVLRARLGSAGRERASSRFTWAAAAKATVDRYRHVVHCNRSGAGQQAGPAAC
ncbi:MAG TPA: glycosyltransferase, partial [Micromonosporaceae bacterium]